MIYINSITHTHHTATHQPNSITKDGRSHIGAVESLCTHYTFVHLLKSTDAQYKLLILNIKIMFCAPSCILFAFCYRGSNTCIYSYSISIISLVIWVHMGAQSIEKPYIASVLECASIRLKGAQRMHKTS